MKDFDEFNNISSTIDYQSYKNEEYNYLQNKRIIGDMEYWLPRYLQSKSSDYKILFSTITFKDTLIPSSVKTIESYLDQSCMRLNRIVCPKKNFRQSCQFLYLPEKTYKKIDRILKDGKWVIKSGRHHCPHIHGFIFIHKNRYQKFLDNAVQSIAVVTTDSGEAKDHYQLIDRVLAPYSNEKLDNSRKFDQPGLHIDRDTLPLNVESTRIHLIDDIGQYIATTKYITKNFKYDFKFDDALVITKLRPSTPIKPKNHKE